MPLPPGVSQHMLPGCGPEADDDCEADCCDNCGAIRSKFHQRGQLRLCLICAEQWDTDPEEVEEVA